MSDAGEPSELELAALMCSKLCHDVISPVGAISNGFEVLEDEKDEAMRQLALEIIQTNARKASARLQFARLAFGAMGAAGDRFPLEDAKRLTQQLYEGEKVSVEWASAPYALLKDEVKLLVNLVVIGAQAIPRGGVVAVDVAEDGEHASFRLVSTGLNAQIPKVANEIFSGSIPEGRVDAHSIQPYYASRLAASVGMTVAFTALDDGVEIAARRAA